MHGKGALLGSSFCFSVFPEAVLLDSRTYRRREFGLELILNSNDQVLFNVLLRDWGARRQDLMRLLVSIFFQSGAAQLLEWGWVMPRDRAVPPAPSCL